MVVRPGVETRRGELVPDVFVAARMFAQTMHQQDVRPGAAGPAAFRGRIVRRPVPNKELRSVGACRPADDRAHSGSVRVRQCRYDALVPTWIVISDRVFVLRYAFYDQNIGVVRGDAATLMIDTRSTQVQGRLICMSPCG